MIMSLIYRSSNWDASSDEALENSLKNFFKKYGRFFLQFRNLNTSRTCSRLRKMLKYFFYKNSVYKNIEAPAQFFVLWKYFVSKFVRFHSYLKHSCCLISASSTESFSYFRAKIPLFYSIYFACKATFSCVKLSWYN